MALNTIELRDKIEKCKDKLVERAEKLCDKHCPNIARAGLHNLSALANSTLSVKEIQNFVKYQMGRRTKGEDWSANAFGENLVSELNVIKTDCNVGEDRDLYIALVRLFIGYVVRYAQYLEKAKPDKKEVL
jgi:hypothetical protein